MGRSLTILSPSCALRCGVPEITGVSAPPLVNSMAEDLSCGLGCLGRIAMSPFRQGEQDACGQSEGVGALGALVCTEGWMSSVGACWGWASLGACVASRIRRDASELRRVFR
eukprot:IDg23538t1